MDEQARPPFPPFDEAAAKEKVKKAQDAWNTRDPEKVSMAYTEDSVWRNRDEFFEGWEEIRAFLERKCDAHGTRAIHELGRPVLGASVGARARPRMVWLGNPPSRLIHHEVLL